MTTSAKLNQRRMAILEIFQKLPEAGRDRCRSMYVANTMLLRCGFTRMKLVPGEPEWEQAIGFSPKINFYETKKRYACATEDGLVIYYWRSSDV